MKKKLHFWYQLYDCQLSFGLWIQLIWQRVLLVIRRIFRFLINIKKYMKGGLHMMVELLPVK